MIYIQALITMATLESIQREVGASNEQLDLEITNPGHIIKISELISAAENVTLQTAFELTQTKCDDIKMKIIALGQKAGNEQLLKDWKEKYPANATYRELMKAVLKFTGNAILARKICALCLGKVQYINL